MAAEDNQANWSYSPEDDSGPIEGIEDQPLTLNKDQEEFIQWTASEFVQKHRGSGWYALFFLVIAAVAGLIFFITNDYISTASIVIAAAIFLFVVPKKPRELYYQLDGKGIQIGNRLHVYNEFKSFDLIQHGGVKSINLIPLKRFMPELTIYFPPEQELAIVNTLANHLPHDEYQEKGIDKLIRKLHL